MGDNPGCRQPDWQVASVNLTAADSHDPELNPEFSTGQGSGAYSWLPNGALVCH